MEPTTSSIDDVLATAHLPQEKKELAPEPEPEQEHDDPIEPESEPEPEPEPEPETEEPERETESDHDEYGNERPKQESKTYTEDEVNERINKAVRERLARMEKNQQPTQHQQQQAADAGFEYDENSNQDWQQQLKQFIRQTNEEVQREQQQQQQSQREQRAQMEFEEKFSNGMGKFHDFREVVGQQPITDAMTVATRTMKDPAAFLYAASKRHASDLQRISNIQDPYAQIVEVGRLEERMKKAKETSKAPRPLGQTREDSTVREPEKKELSIEEMMAQADERKLRKLKARRS